MADQAAILRGRFFVVLRGGFLSQVIAILTPPRSTRVPSLHFTPARTSGSNWLPPAHRQLPWASRTRAVRHRQALPLCHAPPEHDPSRTPHRSDSWSTGGALPAIGREAEVGGSSGTPTVNRYSQFREHYRK